MRSKTFLLASALGLLAPMLGAQTTITNQYPLVGAFDLLTGSTGTWILTADDSEHNIVTTIGNPLFPAGNVRIGNNGVAVAGATTGNVSFSNTSIPATGFPPGITAGVAAILPFWDDLTPVSSYDQDIWWKEHAGILHILWYQSLCCPTGSALATISVEARVFGTPAVGAPWIQFVYYDTTFSHPPFGVPGLSTPCDDGGCATVGYLANSTFASNVQWSFNAPAVPAVMVLSIFHDMALTPSSPLGSGSLRLDFSSGPQNGSYFLAVTLAAGSFPNGWLYGLDISYSELVGELMAGPPFTGALDSAGQASIGPLQGVPPVTFYAVAFGFMPSAAVPVLRSVPVSYSVP